MATTFSARVASALALYDGLYGPVLAPRGWDCGSDQGTASGRLSITPRNRTGPFVQLDESADWGAGEYSIAAIGGRYFPRDIPSELTNHAMERFHVTKEELLAPRYSDDVVTYRTSRVLEFVTPANRQGLCTSAPGLGTSPLPTYGVLALQAPPHELSIILLTIRLPPELNYLRATIMKQFERCVELDTLVAEEIIKCEIGGAETTAGPMSRPRKP
ncbi:MAG TPA: hypothetical protein VKU84_08560 [Stellaceae bacterium]|nr:hypothetical protein [Stellaceae bacterium]